MFANLENVDFAHHKALRLSAPKDYFFASKLPSTPLSATEIIDVAKYYPIIFPMEGKVLPVALLSLKEGENAYVDFGGQWRVPYIPAHIRRYPFILGDTEEPGKFVVALDRNAPQLNEIQGEPLYQENGDMAPPLTKAIDFLKMFQEETVATEELVRPLADSGVLTVQRVNLTKGDGSKSSFDGIGAVDTEKLHKLDDATLAAWVRSGLMGLIYAHMASLRNFNLLVKWQKQPGPFQ